MARREHGALGLELLHPEVVQHRKARDQHHDHDQGQQHDRHEVLPVFLPEPERVLEGLQRLPAVDHHAVQGEDAAEAHKRQRRDHDPVGRVEQLVGAHHFHDEVGDVKTLGQADRKAESAQRHRDKDVQQNENAEGVCKAAQRAEAPADLAAQAHIPSPQDVVIQVQAGENLEYGEDRHQHRAQHQDHRPPPAEQQVPEIGRGEGRAAGLGHEGDEPPDRPGQHAQHEAGKDLKADDFGYGLEYQASVADQPCLSRGFSVLLHLFLSLIGLGRPAESC